MTLNSLASSVNLHYISITETMYYKYTFALFILVPSIIAIYGLGIRPMGKLMCAPVKCRSDCLEIIGNNGCPTCDCPDDQQRQAVEQLECKIPDCEPGCTLMLKATETCPKCDCDDQQPNMDVELARIRDRCNSCDERYFKHYKIKNCHPIYEPNCKCPSRFDCTGQTPSDKNVCLYQGKTFHRGEDIPTSNPCEVCSCQQDYLTNRMSVTCIPVECPSVFGDGFIQPGCFEVFEPGHCCPSTIKCDEGNTTEEVKEKTCEFEGKSYHLGQQMYSDEDPCLSCICDESFDGKTSNSCRQFDCTLERDLKYYQAGCVPIYHEKTCCPIEIHCETGKEEIIVQPGSLSHKSDSDYQCIFGNKTYNVNDEIDIKHPTHCVTCTCSTPPDLTCVHKSCEPPPNNDYENCKSIYRPGQCCPTYQCNPIRSALAAPTRQCESFPCAEGCTEVFVPGGCSLCRCENVLCSELKCEAGCRINYNVSPGSCPYCDCPDDIRPEHICDPVKCSPQCFEGINSNGCPMCVCGPLCSPPKCDPGCHIQTDVPDGQCPGCVCDADEGNTQIAPMVACSPVMCPPMCQTVPGDHGCPSCKCDVLCSPPKCLPGCRMETPPYAGPCPGCVCEEENTPDHQVLCSPVLCEPGCNEVSVPNGCSMCKCSDILCSPPKCEPGCTVETEFPAGGCPGCKCPPNMPLDRPQCGPVKCGPQCFEGISPQGCPMCVCGPLCSPPKCDPGCSIQTDVKDGECPGCVCDSGKGDSQILQPVRCSPVYCPPSCRKSIGDSGCETCICDPLCSPPKCAPGCRVEQIPSSGSCPGCVCDSVLQPQIQCSPVKCDQGCKYKYDVSQSPCPYCDCESDTQNPNSEFAILPQSIRCSPPKCEDGCYPKLTPPAACPTCYCENEKDSRGAILPQAIQCSPPKCDPGCYPKLIPPGPCPSCSCDSPVLPQRIQCSPPKCDPGCYPKLVPPGPCPSCSCDSAVLPQRIQCSPPKCHPGCYPKLVPPGPCPSCSCDSPVLPQRIQCSPPKCDPGCYPKLVPPGPCPICSCDSPVFPRTIQCSPPKCEAGCYPKLISGPCPSCYCGDSTERMAFPESVQCSPPKCEPGCYLETNVPSGSCPKCVCSMPRMLRRPEKIQCTPPRCDIGCYPKVIPPNRCATCYCREGGTVGGLECPQMSCQLPCRKVSLTPYSCPMCICDNGFEGCDNPKCDEPGCYRELAPDGCYVCTCGHEDQSPITQQVQCAPVRCGPGCQETRNQLGCPSCECQPLCSPPRCRPGCPAVYDPSKGPCPACSC